MDEPQDLQTTFHTHAANLGALDAIIENLTEGVIIATPEGKLLVMNPEALRQHGFGSVEDAREHLPLFADIFELRTIEGDRIPEEALPLFRAMHGERFSELEVEVRRVDTGTSRYISYSGTPIYNDDGSIRLLTLTSHDVTAKRKAEVARTEREDLFRLVVESAPNGIVMVNPQGEITLANAQALRAFGYEMDDLLGRPIETLIPARLRGPHSGLRGDYMSRPESRAMGAGRDLYGLRKDGSEFPVEIGLSPLQVRDETMVLATIVDITERKRLENTVRFLAQASFVLAGSLDYETTLDTVANLVVPEYADWCGIELLSEEGVLEQVTVAHVDPAKVGWARELRQRYPTNMESTTGSPNVIRTGQPEIYPNLTDDILRKAAVDEEHYQMIVDVGMRSAIVAPLTARERTLGTITLVFAESGRQYRASDLTAIEELARMCALAVDNARLYGEAHREIEDRRRAEEEVARLNRDLTRRLEELQAILEVSPIGFGLAQDGECMVVRPNPALAAMLGVDPGQNISRSNPETGRQQPFRVLQEGRELGPDELPVEAAAHRGVSVAGEAYEILRSDGTRAFVLGYASPLFDEHGVVRGSVGAFVDVTQMKQAEERLRELNETLEQRVLERTSELEVTNRELQVRNRELQEFAYVASHDLQEPLRKIRSFGELLDTALGPRLDEESRMYLQRIQHAAERMSTLISDLLSFSRVQTRGEPFQRVDLNRVVNEVMVDLEEAVRASGAQLEVTDLPRIQADPTQMRQLLQNVIGNALKYAQPGLPPLIRIRARTEKDSEAAPTSGTVAVLEVEDNGIGFDEKYLNRIFTPFQRLHGMGQYAGTGMGLAICRRITERHGGSITARSTPGKGSTFIIRLPVK